MTRVAIAGGGVSGLSAAWYLARAGVPSTLFDPAPRLGGVIGTERIDGCVVEAGPDSFISQKPWALELIRDLGLEAEVIGSNDHLRKTYVLRGGRLVPMPDGLYLMVPTAVLPMITTRLVGISTKCRMALELLRRPPGTQSRAEARRGLTPRADRSVADFVRDHWGQEAVDYLAEPLLAGIYGGDAAALSVASVLPRFVELERRYGSVTRGVLAARHQPSPAAGSPLFLSLKRGMQQLIDVLGERVAGQARIVRAAVDRIEAAGGGWRLHAAGETFDADQVVLALPSHAAAALLGGVDAALAELLAGIPYHSSVTVALGYERAGFRRPLNGFGFLVPRVERRLLTACTWVGTKFLHRVEPDRVLLRAFVGAGADESVLAASDDSLVCSVREELARLMGVTETPVFSRVQRWPRAMAQYVVGHEQRVEQLQARAARLPGLHLAGNAYVGIGIPDCIRTARLAAERILGQ